MRIRHAIAAAALVVAGAANAQATTITFDGVANATVINSLYAALGVTFACSDGNFPGTCNVDGDGANVYARTTAINNSPANVISSLGAGIPGERVNLTGPIQANFTTGQSSVSLDAFLLLSPEGFGAPGAAFLSAFNGTTFLGSQSTSASETWQTLTVGGFGQDITNVRFSSTVGAYPSYGVFDNLVFAGTTPNPDPNPAPVPEPVSMLLVGTGLVGLVARYRRRSA
jgi:hypothetical protein